MKLYDLCLQGLIPRKRDWWLINITGYGPFEYYGTKEEAEQAKNDKAEWEGGRGTKRRANADEIEEGLNYLLWMYKAGYGLNDRELEPLKGIIK